MNLEELDIVVLTNSLEQLECKRRIINELDTKIADAIQTPEELEAEVLEAEETLETLAEKITRVTKFLERLGKPLTMQSLNAHATPFQPQISPIQSERGDDEHSTTVEESDEEEGRRSPVRPRTATVVTRLPKLSLPTFSGNPLAWQTFWDSFDAAVNSNPTLVEYRSLTTYKHNYKMMQQKQL